jgi:hypothetical protein
MNYSNTSNSVIRKVFGKRVSGYSDPELDRLKRTPPKFWEVVYGGMFGNDSPGDGAKYIGRGYNGLTFKGNYKKYRDLLRDNGISVDIVASPEKVNDPKIAAEIAALYFLDKLNSEECQSKYGNSNINDFKDFHTALKAAVNANAGMKKEITTSTPSFAKARDFSSNFDVNIERPS